jgi:Family of unknown function (DUF6174)
VKLLTLIGWCVAVFTLDLIACHAPTSPTTVLDPGPGDILAHRALWASHGLLDYSYTYEFSAFNAFANQPLRLQVHEDTVRSAVLMATGRPVEATYLPTINRLFDLALTAATDHSLQVIAFDPALDYPVRMRFAALPDALSSLEASSLQPLR